MTPMTKAELAATAAIVLNVVTLAFGGGVVWRDVQDNTETNQRQDEKIDAIIPRVERTDANVQFLVKQAQSRSVQ